VVSFTLNVSQQSGIATKIRAQALRAKARSHQIAFCLAICWYHRTRLHETSETVMKKSLALGLVATLLATSLFAGGPVVVEDTVVVEDAPASSTGGLIPILLLGLIGIALSSGGSDAPENCV
jgi:hypothetical protein